jgi:ubiquinone/menaquinone biosynthesis C-methylase UbiE
MISEEPVAHEYRSLDPLQTRILTHQRYSEGEHDIELDVLRVLRLAPESSLLDVGSGTGTFLRRLHTGGHTGRLCAVDASQAAVDAAGAVKDVDARLGDARELPYQDAEFDAVTARHMLYHVPDPVLAIAEARRVLRPGGRFAAVVNRVEPLPLINGAVNDVLAAHGVMRTGSVDAAVNAGNLPGMIESVFGSCDVMTVGDALVFHEPEPVVRYCLSMLTLAGVPGRGPLRETVERAVEDEVRARFAALDGPWRDPKGYVVCSAIKETAD